MTERLSAPDPAHLARAAALLLEGAVVAFPTETVYGLGGLGLRPDVVRAIFAAKGRPADNPVILHVLDLEAALPLWTLTEAQLQRARAATEAFWPGPLTLVLPASALVPPAVRARLPKVAVRAPSHPVARALLTAVDQPLAAPSANASGRPSPTRATDVLATLEGRIAAVLDGGPTEVGVESTVVDLSEPEAVVLRPGSISESDLRAVLRAVRTERDPDSETASPGVRHRHYAPAVGAVRLVDAEALPDVGPEDAVIAPEGAVAPDHALRLPADPAGYARGLYAALYAAERAAPKRLWLVRPGSGPAWEAVNDRLERAAG